MKEVLIIDQIGGNTGSLAKTFKRLKINVKYSSDSTDILHADHIVIPGVGHFANAMQRISDLNLIEPLQEAVIFKKIPVLGICLGMQLICRYSEEGNANGLGWIDAEVKHFNFNDSLNYKRPHIGILFFMELILSNIFILFTVILYIVIIRKIVWQKRNTNKDLPQSFRKIIFLVCNFILRKAMKRETNY